MKNTQKRRDTPPQAHPFDTLYNQYSLFQNLTFGCNIHHHIGTAGSLKLYLVELYPAGTLDKVGAVNDILRIGRGKGLEHCIGQEVYRHIPVGLHPVVVAVEVYILLGHAVHNVNIEQTVGIVLIGIRLGFTSATFSIPYFREPVKVIVEGSALVALQIVMC